MRIISISFCSNTRILINFNIGLHNCYVQYHEIRLRNASLSDLQSLLLRIVMVFPFLNINNCVRLVIFSYLTDLPIFLSSYLTAQHIYSLSVLAPDLSLSMWLYIQSISSAISYVLCWMIVSIPYNWVGKCHALSSYGFYSILFCI